MLHKTCLAPARWSRAAAAPATTPGAGPYATARHAVVAEAKRDQKNEGLYFEYERVDPNEAKEIPWEKGKGAMLQWFCMEQARDMPHEIMGQACLEDVI